MYDIFRTIAFLFVVIASFLAMLIGYTVGFEKEGRPRIFGYQMIQNFRYLKVLVKEERIKKDSVKWRTLLYTTMGIYSLALLMTFVAIFFYLSEKI